MKKRIITIIAVVVCVVGVYWGWQAWHNLCTENTNFEDYLSEDTVFDKAAAVFLPAKEDLAGCEISRYAHGSYPDGREYIWIQVDCSTQNSELVNVAKAKMEMAREEYASYPNGDQFLLNGLNFRCCTVYLDKDYGYAYAEEGNTLYLLFLTDPDLEYMDITSVIKLYQG